MIVTDYISYSVFFKWHNINSGLMVMLPRYRKTLYHISPRFMSRMNSNIYHNKIELLLYSWYKWLTLHRNLKTRTVYFGFGKPSIHNLIKCQILYARLASLHHYTKQHYSVMQPSVTDWLYHFVIICIMIDMGTGLVNCADT